MTKEIKDHQGTVDTFITILYGNFVLKDEFREFKSTVKEEFQKVRDEISYFKTDVKEEFKNVRSEISEVKQELKSLNNKINTHFYVIISFIGFFLGIIPNIKEIITYFSKAFVN